MITLQNLSSALPYLLKNEFTFDRLKTDFPEILADLTTFKNNPNCSCRSRVAKFFTDKLQQEPTMLNKYIYNEQELTTELNKAELLKQHTNYSGKIVTIPKTDEAWKALSQEINQGKIFRSFSVVERENELVVYFL
jgi:hypothetical protein